MPPSSLAYPARRERLSDKTQDQVESRSEPPAFHNAGVRQVEPSERRNSVANTQIGQEPLSQPDLSVVERFLSHPAVAYPEQLALSLVGPQ